MDNFYFFQKIIVIYKHDNYLKLWNRVVNNRVVKDSKSGNINKRLSDFVYN